MKIHWKYITVYERDPSRSAFHTYIHSAPLNRFYVLWHHRNHRRIIIIIIIIIITYILTCEYY